MFLSTIDISQQLYLIMLCFYLIFHLICENALIFSIHIRNYMIIVGTDIHLKASVMHVICKICMTFENIEWPDITFAWLHKIINKLTSMTSSVSAWCLKIWDTSALFHFCIWIMDHPSCVCRFLLLHHNLVYNKWELE
jgi:hypothetical protein